MLLAVFATLLILTGAVRPTEAPGSAQERRCKAICRENPTCYDLCIHRPRPGKRHFPTHKMPTHKKPKAVHPEVKTAPIVPIVTLKNEIKHETGPSGPTGASGASK